MTTKPNLFPDLDGPLDQLGAYLPKLDSVTWTSKQIGGTRDLSFGHLATIKRDVVFATPKSNTMEVADFSEVAARLLRKHNVDSPFIQKLLFQGEKGNITEKAEGDLYDFLNYELPGTKVDLKELVAQLVLAIADLHQAEYTDEETGVVHKAGLVHRDLNSKNILYKRKKMPDGSLSLHAYVSDLDTLVAADDQFASTAGTAKHVAPEMLTEEYKKLTQPRPWPRLIDLVSDKDYGKLNKKAIDCYYLGMVFNEILSGFNNLPVAEKSKEIQSQIRVLKNVVSLLLREDPKKRGTIEDIMQHPFFGGTHKQRQTYFQSVKNKFKKLDTSYGVFAQRSQDFYPQSDDPFYTWSEALQKIFISASALQNKMGFQNNIIRSNELFSDQEVSSLFDAICRNAKELKSLIEEAKTAKIAMPVETISLLEQRADEALVITRNYLVEEKQISPKDLLLTAMQDAIEKYDRINKITKLNKNGFWHKHGTTGLMRAKNLLKDIEKLNAFEIYQKIDHHLKHGEGNNRATSFKTILAWQLKRITPSLPLKKEWDEKIAEDNRKKEQACMKMRNSS